MLVQKMVSLLRVADSLDRGHSQQIKIKSVEKKGEILAIHTEGTVDLSLELLGLKEKSVMFQDVFGYKVVVD